VAGELRRSESFPPPYSRLGVTWLLSVPAFGGGRLKSVLCAFVSRQCTRRSAASLPPGRNTEMPQSYDHDVK
jgi:hypothetical protein